MASVPDPNIFGTALHKLLTLGFFIGKGAHNAHAKQAILKPCVYFADLMSAHFESLSHFFS